jgi:gliding motility-associated-like protein
MSVKVVAQPLPCPPLLTTTLDGIGDTTICKGACTTISCVSSTTIKSTSSYSFSTIPYLPTTFSGGTPILVGTDDIYSGNVTLPFPFCFYGTKYTSCLIGANGEICFNTALAGSGCPWAIPGPIPGTAGSLNAATLNTIMGVYYDIDPGIPGGSITWAIYGTAPCRTFVVSWNTVPLFNTGTCPGLSGTQQIVLYESTYAIDIFIHNKPNCTAWNSGRGSIGIVDPTGANFMFAPDRNATVFAITDSGYRFTPNGSPSWDYTWYDSHTGAVVGSSQSIVVCPPDSTTYIVKGKVNSLCDSFTVYSSVFVNVGDNPKVTHFNTVNPSLCGMNNGSITLYGLVPGISDTIYYKYNGVLQPYVVQVAALDSSLVLAPLCDGVYDSIVVKVGMCHTEPIGPIILIAPPLTIGTGIVVHPSICGAHDGSLTITGLLPGTTFTLNYTQDGAPVTVVITTNAAGSYTLTGLSAGVYANISATASLGPCTTTCTTPTIGPFSLIAPPPFIIKVISSTNPTDCGYCDGVIVLKGVPSFSSDTINYSKNGFPQPPIVTTALPDSTIVLTGLCVGNYSAFSVKIGACLSPATGAATLTTGAITARFDTAVHFGCNGDSVFFQNLSTSAGKLYYIWNFGDGTSDTAKNPMHIFAQGNYTVMLTSTNHYCLDTFKIPVSLVHPLNAGFIASPTLICQGSTVTFTDTSTVTGTATQYAWSFGNGAKDNVQNPGYQYLRTGTYNVRLIVTDWVPCRDTAYATINVDTLSGITLLSSDDVHCAGNYVTSTGLFAALGNTGVTWNFNDGTVINDKNPISHAYTAAGPHTITVTAHYRVCKDTTTSKSIDIMPVPLLDLGNDTSICPGSEIITLRDANNEGTSGASWVWSTGSHTSSAIVAAPGSYYVTVRINNCWASDTVVVKNDCYMNIPNVFTPNGDGINDYFYPRSLLSKGLTGFQMNIYNRWGQLVFETGSLNGAGWDGKMNGVPQPQEVYVYIIEATFRDGQKEHHQGNVTLMR